MTDNEIIKALECCTLSDNLCAECPLYGEVGCVRVRNILILELVRRQQAEIKELKDEICDIDTVNRNLIKEKAEAIKEFAEKLKEYITGEDFYLQDKLLLGNKIDNLAKEMVGGADNEL